MNFKMINKTRHFLLYLLVFVLTDARVYFGKNGRVEVTWQDISAGEKAYTVASNSFNDAVWILTKREFGDGGYQLAYFDREAGNWKKDENQPTGAVKLKQNHLAVDQTGNPAYIDKNGKIQYRKAGQWTKLKGCAGAIAFVGKTSLYKRDCRTGLVHRFIDDQFSQGTWSRPYGKQKASGISGDMDGSLWIHDNENVLRWQSNHWQINRLPGRGSIKNLPKQIAAGEHEHVYVVSTNNEIFYFATFDWQKIPKVRAGTITVGEKGRIYITSLNGKISMSLWQGESKISLPDKNILLPGDKTPPVVVTPSVVIPESGCDAKMTELVNKQQLEIQQLHAAYRSSALKQSRVIKRLTRSLQKTVSRDNEKQKRLELAKTQIANLRSQAAKFQEQKRKNEESLEQLTFDITKLRIDAEKFEAEKQQLNKQLRKVKIERSLLRNRCSDRNSIDSRINSCQQIKTQHAQSILQSEKQLKICTEESKSLKTLQQSQLIKLEKSQQSVEQVGRQMIAVSNKNSALKTQVDDLEANLKVELNKAKSEKEKAIVDIKSASEKLNELRNLQKIASDDIKVKQEQISDLSKTNEELKDRLNQSKEACSIDQLKNAQSEISVNLKDRLNKAEVGVKNLVDKLKSAESEISINQGALEQAQKSSRNYREQLQTTEGRLKSIEKVNKQLISSLNTGNQQTINSLKKDLLEVEAEKQELEEILAKLKTDVFNGNKKTLKDLKILSNRLIREKLGRKKNERELFKKIEKASKLRNQKLLDKLQSELETARDKSEKLGTDLDNAKRLQCLSSSSRASQLQGKLQEVTEKYDQVQTGFDKLVVQHDQQKEDFAKEQRKTSLKLRSFRKDRKRQREVCDQQLREAKLQEKCDTVVGGEKETETTDISELRQKVELERAEKKRGEEEFREKLRKVKAQVAEVSEKLVSELELADQRLEAEKVLVKQLEDEIARTNTFLKGNQQTNTLEFEKLVDELKIANKNIADEKSSRKINENILNNKLSEARRTLKQVNQDSVAQVRQLQSLTEQVSLLKKDNANCEDSAEKKAKTISSLSQKLQTAESTKETLTADTLLKCNKEKSRFAQESQELSEQMQKLVKLSVKQEKQVKRMSETSDATEKELAKTGQELVEKEAELQTLKSEITQGKLGKNDEHLRQILKLSGQVADEKDKNQDLAKQLNDAKELIELEQLTKKGLLSDAETSKRLQLKKIQSIQKQLLIVQAVLEKQKKQLKDDKALLALQQSKTKELIEDAKTQRALQKQCEKFAKEYKLQCQSQKRFSLQELKRKLEHTRKETEVVKQQLSAVSKKALIWETQLQELKQNLSEEKTSLISENLKLKSDKEKTEKILQLQVKEFKEETKKAKSKQKTLQISLNDLEKELLEIRQKLGMKFQGQSTKNRKDLQGLNIIIDIQEKQLQKLLRREERGKMTTRKQQADIDLLIATDNRCNQVVLDNKNRGKYIKEAQFWKNELNSCSKKLENLDYKIKQLRRQSPNGMLALLKKLKQANTKIQDLDSLKLRYQQTISILTEKMDKNEQSASSCDTVSEALSNTQMELKAKVDQLQYCQAVCNRGSSMEAEFQATNLNQCARQLTASRTENSYLIKQKINGDCTQQIHQQKLEHIAKQAKCSEEKATMQLAQCNFKYEGTCQAKLYRQMKKEKTTANETKNLFQNLQADSEKFYRRLIDLQVKYENQENCKRRV